VSCDLGEIFDFALRLREEKLGGMFLTIRWNKNKRQIENNTTLKFNILIFYLF